MSSLEAHSGDKGVVQGLVLVQGPVNDCTEMLPIRAFSVACLCVHGNSTFSILTLYGTFE